MLIANSWQSCSWSACGPLCWQPFLSLPMDCNRRLGRGKLRLRRWLLQVAIGCLWFVLVCHFYYVCLHTRYWRICAVNLLLLIILILLLVGGLPTLGFHHYGYAPSGLVGVLLIVLLVLLLTGRL